MIRRLVASFRALLTRWWDRRVELDLSTDAERRQERKDRVRRMSREVDSLERALRRAR